MSVRWPGPDPYKHLVSTKSRDDGMVWYSCSCGRSGRAWDDVHDAIAEWREHLEEAALDKIITIRIPKIMAPSLRTWIRSKELPPEYGIIDEGEVATGEVI